jgi:hypothetical protein
MKHIVLAVFLLLISLPDAASQQKDKLIPLPNPRDVDRITVEQRSMGNWYTPESLLETLLCLIPKGGTYSTKAIPFQRGTIVLKNGTVLRWTANSKISLLIRSDKGEQLFIVSPKCVASGTVQNAKPINDGEVSTVSYCDLVNKPELYFGKKVRVKAFYTRAREGVYLRGRCAEQPNVGFSFRSIENDESCNQSRENLKRINEEFGGRAEVVVVGILYDKASTHPYVSYKYRFEVFCMERVEKITVKIP